MRKKAIILLAIPLILLGCQDTGPTYYEETDIVLSAYDDNYNFVSKGTYSIPASVVKITGDPGAPPEYIKDIYGIPILAQIESNMTALGWTKVDVNANPDIQVLPVSWTTTTVVGGYYGGYYCWYYPYYCGGGWYYPYPVVSSYSTGSLVMTMVDPKLESTDGNLRVVWSSAINGLLSGTYDASRITNGINQAFTQSPYLKTN